MARGSLCRRETSESGRATEAGRPAAVMYGCPRGFGSQVATVPGLGFGRQRVFVELWWFRPLDPAA